MREPPQVSHRPADTLGPLTLLGVADNRHYATPSIATVSYERADGDPREPQEPGLPAATSGLSTEFSTGGLAVREPPPVSNRPADTLGPSTPLGFAGNRYYTTSPLATVSYEQADGDPREPPRDQGHPIDPSVPSAVFGTGGASLLNTPPTPPSPPRRRLQHHGEIIKISKFIAGAW